VQPHTKRYMYAWFFTKGRPRSWPVSRWFHYGGDPDWPSLSLEATSPNKVISTHYPSALPPSCFISLSPPVRYRATSTNPARDLGSAVSSPAGPGGVRIQNDFWCILRQKLCFSWQRHSTFLRLSAFLSDWKQYFWQNSPDCT